MAYFERLSDSAFRATEHAGGAWALDEQHIAPALGLLTHAVEVDRDARRSDGLLLGRLSFDILGTVPIDVVDVSVDVLRPGRTIELVEATLSHGGRPAVRLRAWLLEPRDTTALQGTTLASVPGPEAMPVWDATAMWPGGFIASVEVRRQQVEPGRAAFWVRTPLDLVRDEAASRAAATVGLLDIANGMTVRVSPQDVAFPNLDLTAHLFTEPRGDWVGLDTTVSYGASGVGVTASAVHDVHGPVGWSSQVVTVRPR